MKSILFNNACVITAHFLLFAWVLLFSKKSQGSLLFLHCSIFKMLFFAYRLFCSEAFQLYHNFMLLSSTFFKFFKKLFKHPRFKLSVIRQLIYYITSSHACQVVFWKVFILTFSQVKLILFSYSPLLRSSFLRFSRSSRRPLTT